MVGVPHWHLESLKHCQLPTFWKHFWNLERTERTQTHIGQCHLFDQYSRYLSASSYPPSNNIYLHITDVHGFRAEHSMVTALQDLYSPPSSNSSVATFTADNLKSYSGASSPHDTMWEWSPLTIIQFLLGHPASLKSPDRSISWWHDSVCIRHEHPEADRQYLINGYIFPT